ncbi:MAG: hypothetical protein L0Z53_20585, partial [Acidobacteriales bacterium]|nr:hypothetical protein [Terriglobales bacterium]
MRAAIEQGNFSQDQDVTINFDPNARGLLGGTISLGIALPALNKNFQIYGLGHDQLTIERNAAVGNFRVFLINSGKSVIIHNLAVANGVAEGEGLLGAGGAILNRGSLELYSVDIHDNTASFIGGGIANFAGTLTIASCNLWFNSCPTSAGGGLCNALGTTSIYNTHIFSNSARWGGGIFNEHGG